MRHWVWIIATTIGAIAGVITIGQFCFNLWEPATDIGDTRDSAVLPTQLVVTRPISREIAVPTSTPTPTPMPPLDRQLREALSISSGSLRGDALLIVAQNAVLVKDYKTAIRAVSATPSEYTQAKSLEFVVRCAIEDGLYDLAAEAAAEVRSSSSRDRLKIEVIEARRWATTNDKTRFTETDPVIDRNFMSCFNDPDE